MASGGWSQKRKRKCRKSLSCPVDMDGESRHEQVEAKLSRREREMLNEGEEIRSPKKESDSSGILRNTRLSEKKEGVRRRRKEDLHTWRGGRSATAFVSL